MKNAKSCQQAAEMGYTIKALGYIYKHEMLSEEQTDAYEQELEIAEGIQLYHEYAHEMSTMEDCYVFAFIATPEALSAFEQIHKKYYK